MKMNKICISLILYLGYTASLYAEGSNLDNLYFDPDFLELPNKSSIDLSQFENNEQLPGNYYVDIYVNTNLIGTENIKFEKIDNGKLIPCLSISDLTKFGIKTSEYKGLEEKGNNCVNLSAIPNATS